MRRGTVHRGSLVDRLAASDEPVITLVAPPGYGKTTVLAQWAQRRLPHVAWVSCDRTDNDPAALLGAVLTSVNAVVPVGPAPARLLATRGGGGIDVVPAFVAALERVGSPIVIVLDHLEEVTGERSRAAIAEFVMRLPAGWQVALAGREHLPIPAARLRAEGRILELGPADLAMTDDEAAALLAGAGVRVNGQATHELVRRTEGWPVALYLGALGLETGIPLTGLDVTGDDRWVTDYLRAELISRQSDEDVGFLLRSSILERLTGPLCDAVVGTTGSARLLEDLVGRTMLVLPLDRHRRWYRYHHLLRDHLRSELRLDFSEELPQLHARAASWYESNGRPEEAVEHAMAAGDADRVAALVLELMSTVWASGRVGTVLRWMTWLSRHPSARHNAAVMAHGALIYALLGRAGQAEELADVAERLPAAGTLPDGSTVAGTLAYLRANLAREGVATMRQDALLAMAGLSPTSPFRATMLHLQGVARLLEGDLGQADALLAHAGDLAAAHGTLPLVGLALAERSVVAVERDDWRAASSFAERARDRSTTACSTATGPVPWCWRRPPVARHTTVTSPPRDSWSVAPRCCARC